MVWNFFITVHFRSKLIKDQNLRLCENTRAFEQYQYQPASTDGFRNKVMLQDIHKVLCNFMQTITKWDPLNLYLWNFFTSQRISAEWNSSKEVYISRSYTHQINWKWDAITIAHILFAARLFSCQSSTSMESNTICDIKFAWQLIRNCKVAKGFFLNLNSMKSQCLIFPYKLETLSAGA